MTVLTYVLLPSRSRVVLRTFISASPHSSPGSSATTTDSSGELSPWLNQSWFWNWIQAAASTLSVVAGLKLSRTSSLVLTVRGLGVMSLGGSSGTVMPSGWLRPKRAPAMPIRGWAGS